MASRNRRGKGINWTVNSSESEDSETVKKAVKKNRPIIKSSRKRKSECQSDESSSNDSDEDSSRKKKKLIKKPPADTSFNLKKRPLKSHSDSSSSKEFQKPFKKKMKSFRIDEANYTIVQTPSRSDDEDLPVEKELESSLKQYVSQEVKKIKKISVELDGDLDLFENYTLQKKIDFTHKSKFLPHKILKIYEGYFHKIKTSRDKFIELYRLWLDDCKLSAKNTSVHNISKNSFNIYSDDSISDSEIKKNKSLQFPKKNTKSLKKKRNTSDSSDGNRNNENSSFHNKSNKGVNVDSKSSKTNSDDSEIDNEIKNNKSLNTTNKNSKKSVKKIDSSVSEDDEINVEVSSSLDKKQKKNFNVDLSSPKTKPESKNKSILKDSSKKKSNIQNSNLNSSSNDEQIQNDKSQNINSSIKNNSPKSFDGNISEKNPNEENKNNLESSDIDVNVEDEDKDLSVISNSQKNESYKNQQKNIPISDCDSEEIFSADESRISSKNLTFNAKPTSEDENSLSPEEIENSPIRSPELKSKSLRKTLFFTTLSKIKNVQNIRSGSNKSIQNTSYLEKEKKEHLEKIDEKNQKVNSECSDNVESEIEIDQDENINKIPAIKISESKLDEVSIQDGNNSSKKKIADENCVDSLERKKQDRQEKNEGEKDKIPEKDKRYESFKKCENKKNKSFKNDEIGTKLINEDEVEDLQKKNIEESEKNLEKQKNKRDNENEINKSTSEISHEKSDTDKENEINQSNAEVSHEKSSKEEEIRNSENLKKNDLNKSGNKSDDINSQNSENSDISDVESECSIDLSRNAKKRKRIKKKDTCKEKSKEDNEKEIDNTNNRKKKSLNVEKSKISNKESSLSEESYIDINDEEEKKGLHSLLQDWDSESGSKSSENISDKSIDSNCSTVLLGEQSPHKSKIKHEILKKKKLKPGIKSIVLSSNSSSEDEVMRRIPRRKTNYSSEDTDADSNSATSHFDAKKNIYYRNDKKLHSCYVAIRRLPKDELKKYSKALEKSKEYVEKKKFNRYRH